MRLRRLEPRLPGPAIRVEVGTAYEALLGLMLFAGHEPPGSYDIGPGWFRRVRRAASARLTSDVDRLCAGAPTVFGHLLGLARRAEAPRDLADLIDRVAALSPDELRLHLLGYHSVQGRVPPEVLERATAGDGQAVGRLLEIAGADVRWAQYVRALLASTPKRAHALTLRVLRRWRDEVFATQEAALRSRLHGQAERWQARAQVVGWPRLAEEATGGLVFDGDLHLPAHTVLLVPSVLTSPWVHTSQDGGVQIVCCPVTSQADQQQRVPENLVELARALADGTRLRLLRRVADGAATLTELAEHTGLAKSTAHRHLVLLRQVGLVQAGTGRDRRYSLRDELPDLRALLSAYLQGEG